MVSLSSQYNDQLEALFWATNNDGFYSNILNCMSPFERGHLKQENKEHAEPMECQTEHELQEEYGRERMHQKLMLEMVEKQKKRGLERAWMRQGHHHFAAKGVDEYSSVSRQGSNAKRLSLPPGLVAQKCPSVGRQNGEVEAYQDAREGLDTGRSKQRSGTALNDEDREQPHSTKAHSLWCGFPVRKNEKKAVRLLHLR
jgi:hypothetical protein